MSSLLKDQSMSKEEGRELTLIDAERDPDDGEISVMWWRGDDMITLICRPDGSLIRIVSPYREEEPILRTHILSLGSDRVPGSLELGGSNE